MKAIVFIILWTVGLVGAGAIALAVAHVKFNPIDPITAITIGVVSGVLGIVPLTRSGRRDPSSILQMAMVGTVLHLLGQIVFAGGMLATHIVSFSGSFVFWLIGEYWVSLAALIIQLRRMIVIAIPGAKVQN